MKSIEKQALFNYCLNLINSKIALVEVALKELRETGSTETKSTAGDKHETALAMIQIEQENKRVQLQQLLMQKAELLRIDPDVICKKGASGSLIYTNNGIFFLSISLGKIIIGNIEVFCLSAASPLGQKLYQCVVNSEIKMPNGKYYVIEQIA